METFRVINMSFVLSCFIFTTGGQMTDSLINFSPQISVYPLNVVIKSNQNLFLTCKYGDTINEFEKIVWVLNGTDLIPNKYGSRDRHKFKVDSAGNHSLLIWNVDVRNGGIYNCKVINAEGIHYSSNIFVEVLVPSRPTITYEVTEPWVRGQKRNVTFHCQLKTSQDLYMTNVKWYIEWESFTTSNNCISLDMNSSESDCQVSSIFSIVLPYDDKAFHPNGRYSCRGLNSYGWGDLSHYVKFSFSTVPGASKISCDYNPIIRGHKLTCECNAWDRGYPKSQYRWYHNGELIEGTNSSQYKSIILTTDNHIIYSCETHNVMGTGRGASIKIDVQDKPDFYVLIEPEGPIYEGSNITMRCKSYNESTSQCPLNINWLFDWSTVIAPFSNLCESVDKPDLSKSTKVSQTYVICREANKGSSLLHFLWVSRVLMGKEYSFQAKDYRHRIIHSEKVKLVINYKPAQPMITYSPGEVNRGDVISLFCNASLDMGNPVAKSYRWYYRAIEIADVTGDKIVVKSNNLDNPALFSCRAVNTVGDGGLRNVYIDILDSSISANTLSGLEFFNYDNSDGAQKTVSVYPSKVNGEATKSVYLTCRYGDDPISEFEDVIWIRNGVEVAAEDDKYLTIGRNDNHSLFISNFDETFVGIYNCKIKNVNGIHISPDITVDMLVVPKVELVIERQTPRNGEKTNATLHCKRIQGNPSNFLKVQWSLFGTEIAETVDCDYKDAENEVSNPQCQSGSHLSLDVSEENNSTFNEFGDYRCSGFNSFKWSDWSEPNYINMATPSAAIVNHSPPSVFKGRKVRIHCDLKNNDPTGNLDFRWYKDDKFIKNGSMGFEIDSINFEDEGKYSCEAANMIGGVGKRGSLVLRISDGPDFYLSLEPQKILKEGDNVTLRCVHHNYSSFISPDKPKWIPDLRNGYLGLRGVPDCKSLKPLELMEIPIKNIQTKYQICTDEDPPALHLINIDRSLEGKYRCGTFRAGEHLESDDTELVIHYKPDQPTLIYTPTEVHRGDILILSCDGSMGMGVPKSTSYRWYKRSIIFDVRTPNITIKTDDLESPVFFSCRLVNSEGFGDLGHVLIDILDPVDAAIVN